MEKFFDQREAKKKLNKYRKSGPQGTTLALIKAIESQGVSGRTLLDIGGGVGAIQHELLKIGAAKSTGVDASSAYIEAVEEEARQRGHSDRLKSVYGDFTEIASEIEPADIVTLDRVICCFHDLDRLVGLSSEKANFLFGLVYPCDNWGVRSIFGLFNLYLRITRNTFRVFVHSSDAVDKIIRSKGLQPRFHSKTMVWQVALYERSAIGLQRSV